MGFIGSRCARLWDALCYYLHSMTLAFKCLLLMWCQINVQSCRYLVTFSSPHKQQKKLFTFLIFTSDKQRWISAITQKNIFCLFLQKWENKFWQLLYLFQHFQPFIFFLFNKSVLINFPYFAQMHVCYGVLITYSKYSAPNYNSYDVLQFIST